MDIVLNFRTTYVNSKTGTEVINSRKIMLNYAFHGRFFIDLLASIPFELIVSIVLPNTEFSFQVFGLLKLVRLLRLGRIITYMKFKQGLKIGFRIFQLLFFLLLLVHWIGCIWYILVRSKDSWLPPKDLDSGDTNFYEISNLRQYTVVFYYAILLIVGNESAPKSTEQTIFSSLVVIMGAIVTAFIFGNMAALMATINKKDSHFQEQLDFVSTTMRSIKLPEDIQTQVIEYLMHWQESPDVQQDIEKFFDILSPSLKNMILNHMYSKIIDDIDVFNDSTDIEKGFIVNNLKTMLFLVDDEIIRQGDFGNRMYFISSGTVSVFLTSEKYKKDLKNEEIKREGNSDSDSVGSDDQNVLMKNEVRINRLSTGNYFGEIALVTNLKRTATVKAVDYTTLTYLTRDNFMDIKKEFPQVYLNFKHNIKNYSDNDFEFRRSMIKNTPYFRNLDHDIVDEIVYLLRPNRFDPGTTIIKYGDITDKIHYLKQGEIDVTIPVKVGISQTETHFETLNAGSCFWAFSAFSDDVQQLVNFKAKTSCIVETIDVKDLQYIERTYLQLSDEVKKLKLLIDNKDKSELDFFRYLKPLKREHKENIRAQVRKKFKAAVKKFTKKYKENKTCLPNALIALQDIMKERRKKQREILHLQRINTIKYLQEKSPLINPSHDMNSMGVNMFINQTIQNQYNIQNFNQSPQYNQNGPNPSQNMDSYNHNDKAELEMLKKMDEEAGKEKMKTNQNLSKLLNLIEVHNSTLENIESKFKREFSDIKDNIKKIKAYQIEQQKLNASKSIYHQENCSSKGTLRPVESSLGWDSDDQRKKKQKAYRSQPKDLKPEEVNHKKNENPLHDMYPKAQESNEVGASVLDSEIETFVIPQSNTNNASPLQNHKSKAINQQISELHESEDSAMEEQKKHSEDMDEDLNTPGLKHTDSNVGMIDETYSNDGSKTGKDNRIASEQESEEDEKLEEHSEESKSDPNNQSDPSSESSEEEKELNKSLQNNMLQNENQKKLSEVSFEESSGEEGQVNSEEGKVNFEENMPRLNEENLPAEGKKVKRKKKKIKFKKGNKNNMEEMDALMRQQASRKEKAQYAKTYKNRKSYHAYLEHPKGKKQPSLQSPKESKRKDEVSPTDLASRPKHN